MRIHHNGVNRPHLTVPAKYRTMCSTVPRHMCGCTSPRPISVKPTEHMVKPWDDTTMNPTMTSGTYLAMPPETGKTNARAGATHTGVRNKSKQPVRAKWDEATRRCGNAVSELVVMTNWKTHHYGTGRWDRTVTRDMNDDIEMCNARIGLGACFEIDQRGQQHAARPAAARPSIRLACQHTAIEISSCVDTDLKISFAQVKPTMPLAMLFASYVLKLDNHPTLVHY